MRHVFTPGYTPDTPAKRARAKSSRLLLGKEPPYPAAVSNRQFEKMLLDQGPIGSCGGHGTSHWLQVASGVQGVGLGFVPSPGGVYTTTRCLERVALADGTLPPLTDSGIMPADLVLALSLWGVRPIGELVSDPGGEVRNSDVDAANVNDEPDLEELEQEATHLVFGQYRIDERAPDVMGQTYAAISQVGALGVAPETPFWKLMSGVQRSSSPAAAEKSSLRTRPPV